MSSFLQAVAEPKSLWAVIEMFLNRFRICYNDLRPQGIFHVFYELCFQFCPLAFDYGFIDSLHLTHCVGIYLKMNPSFGVLDLLQV